MAGNYQNDTTDHSLLYILKAAEEAGFKKLTRTQIVKFLYLLDLFVSEEMGGKSKLTNLNWKFLHYGPYTSEVLDSINHLIYKNNIIEDKFQNDNNEGFLYSIPDWLDFSKFNLDIPNGAIVKLKQSIRDYGSNLSKLLNFVYFKTDPMLVALPGEILDFSMCRKFDLSSVKPIPMKPLDAKKVAELRNKRTVEAKRKEALLANINWGGQYDEEYQIAMSSAGDDQISVLPKSRAKISISK